MLTKLLALLKEGRMYSQQELAECLGVAPGTVTAQMEYLEGMGILRRVQSSNCSCSGGCKSCSADCHSGGSTSPTMWELSMKE